MRPLIVSTFMTLDGVMQAPGGPEEDPSGGFEHGGWSVNYWDEAMMGRMGEAMADGFDLLLGRKTYEIFAAHWPHTDEPGADVLNDATKHVASRTLDEVDWQNSALLEGDLAPAVTALKEQDGPEIQVHGSADLIQSLLEHGLVDEFRLWTFPLVVGPGQAPVRRRHAAGRPGAGGLGDLLHGSRDGHLPHRRRGQPRIVRARTADRGGIARREP